jgi:hypothetical protein
LDWTNEWYQAYYRKEDMPKFTRAQISRYQNMRLT